MLLRGVIIFYLKHFKIQECNKEKNIRTDTSIAKDEDISAHGNKLGIIDRIFRTLKEIIENIELY